jgi:hypothetical protein
MIVKKTLLAQPKREDADSDLITEQYTNIRALLAIDRKILPTEPAAPPPAIVKNHTPTAMSLSKRHCSAFP